MSMLDGLEAGISCAHHDCNWPVNSIVARGRASVWLIVIVVPLA
jgi:hypothetical protein